MKRCWTNEEAPDGARTEASAARGWVWRRAVAAVCWGLVTGTAVAVPFTYQGRLVDGTALANGNYELRFRLFDSLAAGTQVGGEVSLPTVGVTNGLFTVQLEFGNGVFTGADRWLELSARPAGDPGALSVFDPRQPITAVPYALYSLAGSGDAAALTSGLLPDARLSGNIARSADLLTFSNTFGARLGATNDALQAQLNQLSVRLDQLTTSLLGVSNQFVAQLPPGVVVASVQANDPTLLGQGLAPLAKLDAPGWKNGAAANAPGARHDHTGVWSGSRLLVWGGTVAGSPAATGGSYDPATDTWAGISPVDAPAARSGHTAVWTGDRMVVWGGFGANFLGTGGAYAPASQTWTTLATLGAPAGRDGQAAVWTGSRMLVWGGRNSDGLLGDGAAYDPAGNAWAALPSLNAPSARRFATAAWAGDRLILFGGEGTTGALGTGAALPLAGGVTPGAWTALPALNAPTARLGHTAVWTGSRLLVWGGKNGGTPLGDGAAYDPAGNTWTPLPTLGAPAARSGHVAVWTGTEMLVCGGENAGGPLATGGAYDPATGRWRTLSDAGQPVARSGGAGVWSGTELLVFGGLASSSPSVPTASLQRLNPQPTWYLYRKP
jgi:N-acetylneuraminic acid mutarotase